MTRLQPKVRAALRSAGGPTPASAAAFASPSQREASRKQNTYIVHSALANNPNLVNLQQGTTTVRDGVFTKQSKDALGFMPTVVERPSPKPVTPIRGPVSAFLARGRAALASLFDKRKPVGYAQGGGRRARK